MVNLVSLNFTLCWVKLNTSMSGRQRLKRRNKLSSLQ